MKALLSGFALACLLSSSGPVFAAATEFSRGQTTVTVGSNTITVDNNVKYVNYTVGETLTVTLHYSGTCKIAFSGLNVRLPKAFTPHGVAGTVTNVSGTPPPASPDTTGSVTFDIDLSSLKTAGKAKKFGMAHLNLVLGADACNDGDEDIDGTVTIGVQISVSTVSHP